MMKRRRQYRKPDSLIVLAAAVTLAAVMTSVVKAEELIDYRPADPATRLVSLFMEEGYRHDRSNPASSLQVSFTPPEVSTVAPLAGSGSMKPSHIHFSWRMRW